MNIVHLNTERGWRGGERQTLLLARALASRGHGTWVAGRPIEPLVRRAAEAGLSVLPAAPLFEFDLWMARRLRGWMEDLSVDVLHAHTGHAVGLGALAVRGTRVRLVVTRRVDFPLKRCFPTRWKYGRADAVACISSRILELALEAGVPAEKTVVIPSGIDPSSYPSTVDRDRLRRERNVPRADVVLVHVGALVPHKDQATLLRAIQRVAREEPKIRLFVVGNGPLRGSLERLSRELGVAGRVTFVGNDPDPLAWTALADLFVFSSKEEGLGTALIDALALGVPTAATSAGGIPDIYGGPGAPELSPPGSPEDLARNILSVLRDPAEASRRAARGRERAALFTVDAMAGRYEALYEKVTASIS